MQSFLPVKTQMMVGHLAVASSSLKYATGAILEDNEYTRPTIYCSDIRNRTRTESFPKKRTESILFPNKVEAQPRFDCRCLPISVEM